MDDGEEMSRDMEMNESPLLPIPGDHNNSRMRRQNIDQLRPVILLYWSMELFILAGARGAAAVASLSRVPSSVLATTDAEDGLDLEKGSDDGAAGPGPADFQQNNSSASQTDKVGIELQQRQRNTVKKIVREKNLQSLNHRLGGVKGVADVFNTDLETGISDNTEEISKRKMVQVSQDWALAQSYLHFLEKSCKSWSIVLLFLAGVLSLAFGIKEEGLQSGWLDGAIVFVTLFVLLLFSSIRNWLEARTARKKSHKEQILQIGVVRGGKEVLISVSDLVYGDLVCLMAGCLIPADGLFASGEGLEIDDGTLSICNKQNPFLFYGSRVVKGSAKMLVISEGMDDTVLGEMMREAMNSSTQKKTNIETSIDKLSECTNIGGILISILICVVAFLRFMRGKIDDGSGGNRPDSKGAPTELERILHSLKIIFTVSKGNARVLTTLLGVSLVGIMEGIPFVVSIAIARWNSKTLSDRASAKDVLGCVRMAKVTTILGMFDLKYTSQQETRDSPIASLVESGIKIILFSQHDDVSELKRNRRECGISETDAEVLTGGDLQKCTTDEELFEKLESIKVVGNCNLSLKQRIVRCLRSKGEVVAVVGERSADAPIMKEADIGLAIKTKYPEITTESANLIIVKGSFSLLIDMIICGRIINENLKKFIQVEVITTIATSLINFISAVSSGDTPLSAIQLFWIYFLISFPGALALMSGQPNKNLQDTIRPTGPLITKAMWVNILLQSSYQIGIFVTLQLKGTAILGISQEANESMIFNGFVFCQLFNIFSARELKELNIFKGIRQNPWFLVGSGAFVVIHAPFVAVYGSIAGDAGMNWKQWFECCLIGAGTWLLDLVRKKFSNSRDWLIRMCRRSTSMSLNASAPSESMSNLQNPLMTGSGSTPNTVQSNTSG